MSKGWYNQSYRHSLAAHGTKTSFSSSIDPDIWRLKDLRDKYEELDDLRDKDEESSLKSGVHTDLKAMQWDAIAPADRESIESEIKHEKAMDDYSWEKSKENKYKPIETLTAERLEREASILPPLNEWRGYLVNPDFTREKERLEALEKQALIRKGNSNKKVSDFI